MKTIYYNNSDGSINHIKDGEWFSDGLADGVKYATSELADGSETNISQIADIVEKREKRIIRGDLISDDTKSLLENATSVPEIKSALITILFGE